MKDKVKTIQIFLDTNLHRNLKSVSALAGVPMQEFIIDAIKRKLEKENVHDYPRTMGK